MINKGEKDLIDRLMKDRLMIIQMDRQIEKQKIKDYIESKTNIEFSYKQKVLRILF